MLTSLEDISHGVALNSKSYAWPLFRPLDPFAKADVLPQFGVTDRDVKRFREGADRLAGNRVNKCSKRKKQFSPAVGVAVDLSFLQMACQ